MKQPVDERFWSKVDATGDCWQWTSAVVGNGYGGFRLDGKSQQAHRIAYESLVGPIPLGMEIDHLCRSRLCVNPDHLEIVTHGDNVRRGYGLAGKNVRKTHCPQGHPYSGENLYEHPNKNNRICRICVRESGRRYLARKVLT